jgi:hypothetical protein
MQRITARLTAIMLIILVSLNVQPIFSQQTFQNTSEANNSGQVQTVSFTENKGQLCDQYSNPRPDILFSGSDGQMDYFLGKSGISYQMSYSEGKIDPANISSENLPKNETTIQRIDIRWRDANSELVARPDKSLPGYKSYYLGHCPEGVTNVKSYAGVTIENLYPGIDLHYYQQEGHLKSDYIVTPNSDYRKIQLEVLGAEIRIQKNGSLKLVTPMGEIEEGAPIVFQNGKQLSARWMQQGNILSFEVDDYDPNEEMIIDPITRIWGTYYGNSGNDLIGKVIANASGDVFMSGSTFSTTGIATSGGFQSTFGGAYDAFLAKFNSSGILQWATYYGGTNLEFGYSCAVDNSGNSYLTGFTFSSNAISTPGAHQQSLGGMIDAFLVKFNSAGTRQWATFYGGTADDYGNSVTTDQNGNVYLCGSTTSSSGISTPGSHQVTYTGTQDGYMVKFNSSGVRQWGTYYGGTAVDNTQSCAADAVGNLYFSGTSASNGGISSASSHQSLYAGGTNDAFLVKFNTLGVRQWGTYYGGSNEDNGASCTTDQSGNVFLTGRTASTNGISSTSSHQVTFGGGTRDAYLAKFNSSGTRLWGTYYGGTAGDAGFSCRTDAAGNAYLAGDAGSTTGIATPGAYQSTLLSTEQAFFAIFNSSGIRQYGTYYSGNSSSTGRSCAVSSTGAIYLAGETNSALGIATPGSHQDSLVSGPECFLAKFFDCNLVVSGSSQTNVSCFGGMNGTATVSATGGSPSYTYNWSPGGATTPTASNLSAGAYSCTISDLNGCPAVHSVTISAPLAISASVSQSNVSCNGGTNGSATLSVSGGTQGYNYAWSSGGSVTATASGLAAGNYSCTVTDANSCSYVESILITEPVALASSNSGTDASCFGGNDGTASVNVSGGTPSYSYAWSSGGGNAATATGLLAGTYSCTITDANFCTLIDSVSISEPTDLVLSPTQTDVSCYGGNDGTATVSGTGGTPGYTYAWSSNPSTAPTATGLSAGTYICSVTDANNCIATQTVVISQPSQIDTSVTVNGTSLTANNTASTYQWVDCNIGNQAIPGAVNQAYSPVASGTFAVALSVNGCQDTSSCYQITIVGRDEPVSNGPTFELHPNPTSGQFKISITGNSSEVRYRIINALGVTIAEETLSDAIEISASIQGSSGIYFIEVTFPDEGVQRTARLIKY